MLSKESKHGSEIFKGPLQWETPEKQQKNNKNKTIC